MLSPETYSQIDDSTESIQVNDTLSYVKKKTDDNQFFKMDVEEIESKRTSLEKLEYERTILEADERARGHSRMRAREVQLDALQA